MNKKNSLYVATRLENGASDLICMIANKREDLEKFSGINIREVVYYDNRKQAIEGIKEQLPYVLDTVPSFLYDNMVKNGGSFETGI